tara:strand:+ start:63 stop:326 length:264 start_codon:yes stop_codon:yes gene_type:complete
MNEPVVTIKLTESELKLINEMILIEEEFDDDERLPAKRTLIKQLIEIEEWIDEEKTKATIDKRVSKETPEGQAEGESSKRICVSCDD